MSLICFVIQPFDKGTYDRRYEETYKPAIEAAGYKPYRVDKDLSVNIIYRNIENGIRDSSVCFADISENNPNVWYEVGLAVAFSKEICLICSDNRQIFPFDVQHRNIIKYTRESIGDFEELKTNITNRLLSMSKSEKIAEKVKNDLPNDGTLHSSCENEVISIIASNDSPNSEISAYELRDKMENAGFINMLKNLVIVELVNKKYIQESILSDINGNYEYAAYSMTKEGWNYIRDNIDRFDFGNLGESVKKSKKTEKLHNLQRADNDLPF